MHLYRHQSDINPRRTIQLPPSHIESHSVLQPLVKMVARLHVTVIGNPLSKASWSQATAVQPAIFRVVKELPVILPRVGVVVLGRLYRALRAPQIIAPRNDTSMIGR